MKSLHKVQMPFDATNPPIGVRLNLGTVAARLRITVTEMAEAAHISRTAIADLLNNKWPARRDHAEIRSRLLELMEARGAHDEDLTELFHARIHSSLKANSSANSSSNGLSSGLSTPDQPHALPPKHDEEPEMLLARQSLTPIAKRHFRLFTNPFEGEVTSDEQMFVGGDLRYCQESMRQCAKNGGFVAVVGESGAGKTTLLQDLESWLETEDRTVIVIRPSVLGMEGNDTKGKAIKSADILHAIITRLDSSAPVPQSVQARTVKAGKLLASSAQTGNTHLLVVEEAHSMPDATLKHLKRLHEMRLGRKPLLGILLLAQPELKHKLADGLRNGSLREVAQRCEVVDLLPLDNELKPYLLRRANAVNVKLADLIDDDAIEALRSRMTIKRTGGAVSMCYPLAVNNMVIKAMNEAARLGAPKVTKDIVAGL